MVEKAHLNEHIKDTVCYPWYLAVNLKVFIF